jgi:hypothetical protein
MENMLSEPRRTQHPPFIFLPRHRRSEAVVRLKNQIRRTAAYYGGRFTSDLVMEEAADEGGSSQWLDFTFVGTNRFTLWNAVIRTTKCAFRDSVHGLAHARAWAALSDEEQRQETAWEFEPADRAKTGKVLTYRMVPREFARYAKFDGRTLAEQIHLLEAKTTRDEPPAIHESFRLDRSYRYGIGLDIVVDVPIIDRASVEMAIDRFVAIGETDWVADAPVPHERLSTTRVETQSLK